MNPDEYLQLCPVVIRSAEGKFLSEMNSMWFGKSTHTGVNVCSFMSVHNFLLKFLQSYTLDSVLSRLDFVGIYWDTYLVG